RALNLAPKTQGVEAEAALALAISGDITGAESLKQDLEKRFPLDTQVQSLWLPTISAQLALTEHNPAVAVEFLQKSLSIELAYIPSSSGLSCLNPIYVRGQAYLSQGNGQTAATEFQRILDHNGIVWYCATGALAHLGLARANALEFRKLNGPAAE